MPKTKKTPTKKKTKETKKDLVEIVYIGRTQEAAAEMRSAISAADPLTQLKNIDDDYKALLKEISTKAKPSYETTVRWKESITILNNRSNNAFKLLNKLAPDFMPEELTLIEGNNGVLDSSATRDEALAKLSKVLKPKSKVSNIKDA